MVSEEWKLNQQIFHSMFYDGSDEGVVNLYEKDEYTIKRNIVRYFQHDCVELSYPSKQYCVRYIYAKFIEKHFGTDAFTVYSDCSLLYNNGGEWAHDYYDIFIFLENHIGDPFSYVTEGVISTIKYAKQELLLDFN